MKTDSYDTKKDDESTIGGLEVGSIVKKLAKVVAYLVAIIQIFIVSVVIIFYYLTVDIFGAGDNMLTSIITLTIVFEVIGFLIVWNLLSAPLKSLTRSIGILMRDSILVHPPNINARIPFVGKEISRAITYLYTNSDQLIATDQDSTDNDQAVRILGDLPVGIIAFDHDLNIISYNQAAPIIVGEEMTLMLDFRDSPESLSEWYRKVRDSSLEASMFWERVQNTSSGSTVDRHVYDVVAHYQKYSASGADLILITIDRTDDYIEDEAKASFVFLAAHEIRTPVTAIRGYLEILEDSLAGKINNSQQEIIDRISVSARRLNNYVNNVLNASRYDQDHLELHLEEKNIYDAVEGLRNDLDMRAKLSHSAIDWRVPSDLPTVAIDEDSIDEVITNLIDNALKYSKDSKKNVEVTALDNGNNYIEFSVTDHGIGIPASVADKMFVKFYRSHRTRGSVGGSGIGLYISKAIIESHGGSIGFRSVEGSGTTFTFKLPTYQSIKSKLNDNSNKEIVKKKSTMIKNHSRIQS